MSVLSGQPDYVYSVGADTRMLDKAMSDTTKKTESAFGRVGTSIERKTEGLRRFQGALSSTIGIATGLVGVFGAAAGAAAGLYAAYDQIANAADRVAEANRKSNEQTSKAIALAREKIAVEENFLDVLKSQNKETIEARLDELRAERDKIDADLGFGRQFKFGFNTLLKEALAAYEFNLNVGTLGLAGNVFGEENMVVDSGLARYEGILAEIAKAEKALGEINRGTEDKVGGEVTEELLKQEATLRRQLKIQTLRAEGMDGEASAIERRVAHEAEIFEMEERYLELVDAGLDDQAAQLEGIIRLKRQIYSENEQALAQAREQAEMEKRSMDKMTAVELKRNLQARIYRAQGRDDLADQLKMEEERLDYLKKINNLDISQAERDALIEQVDLLSQLQGGGSQDAAGGRRTPRFGSSVEGNVGSAVAAQVLGGGVDTKEQEFARQQAKSLQSLDTNVKALVVAVRDGAIGGPAVFA